LRHAYSYAVSANLVIAAIAVPATSKVGIHGMCVRRNHNTGTSAGGLAKTVIALKPASILLRMRILRCWRRWLRKHAPRHACKKCQQYQGEEVTGAV
jgi:hypothetical protein